MVSGKMKVTRYLCVESYLWQFKAVYIVLVYSIHSSIASLPYAH